MYELNDVIWTELTMLIPRDRIHSVNKYTNVSNQSDKGKDFPTVFGSWFRVEMSQIPKFWEFDIP